MHYHLPWPIEQASIHDIPSLKSKVIVFEVTQPKTETLELITGDGNLIDSQVEIQYSVAETKKYINYRLKIANVLCMIRCITPFNGYYISNF